MIYHHIINKRSENRRRACADMIERIRKRKIYCLLLCRNYHFYVNLLYNRVSIKYRFWKYKVEPKPLKIKVAGNQLNVDKNRR